MANNKFKLLLVFLTTLLISCSSNLNNEIIQNDQAFNKLTDYIYSHHPSIEDNMEIMDFTYSASMPPSGEELSSFYMITFVSGSDKNQVVEYHINNQGILTNNNVDVSIGEDITSQTLSNKYEAFKPFTFSSKKLDFNILRNIIKKATEKFKTEANVDNAYCSSLSIEKEADGEPEVYVTITQREFASKIFRSTSWTLDGKPID